MNEEKAVDKITLEVIDFIQKVIINEIGCLIYPNGNSGKEIQEQVSPFIKFLPIISSIEFLGACYDQFSFIEEGHSEDRFNVALKRLFKKEYLPFSKADNKFYFYEKLRCAMVHQLRPAKGIMFTTRFESKKDKTEHLKEDEKGNLILVLEDFYDDLIKSSKKIIDQFKNKKITNKKGEQAFIDIISY